MEEENWFKKTKCPLHSIPCGHRTVHDRLSPRDFLFLIFLKKEKETRPRTQKSSQDGHEHISVKTRDIKKKKKKGGGGTVLCHRAPPGTENKG